MSAADPVTAALQKLIRILDTADNTGRWTPEVAEAVDLAEQIGEWLAARKARQREYLTASQLSALVAERLKDSPNHTYADADTDVVDGSLTEVVTAVVDVLDRRGELALNPTRTESHQ